MPELFLQNDILQRGIGTVLLVAAIFVVRALLLRMIRDREQLADADRLRWHLRIGQAGALVLLLGLVIIWAPQLRSLALSAVAIAAALVIATKELLMCLSGTMLRASVDSYTVGDRIEVNGLSGDVISYGALATTLLEVGPSHQHTGRSVVFPNSLLLSQPVINETFTDEYVLHTFSVFLNAHEDWAAAEKALLAIAKEVCDRHQQPANRQMQKVAKEHGLGVVSADPRVVVCLPDADTISFLVRVPAPAREKGRLERQIVHRFLEHRCPAGPEQASP